MKKPTFKYKNRLPKTLKSKKAIEKEDQPKLEKRIKKPRVHRNMPFLHRRKPKRFSNRETAWKLPSLLFVLTLVTIIIVIPTLIVVPFIKDEKEAAITEVDSPVKVSQSISPFSVAVMRTDSEVVEDVPLETYVRGVVASEMPAHFEIEALKAQGLAARTYIVNHLLYQNNEEESDVTDTVQHQVYKSEEELRELWGPRDFDTKMRKLTEAVEATQGEILTYKDEPITPAFFSTSNGYTENSEDYWENELPYLRSVKSIWDEESPKYLDQKVFTFEQIEEALQISITADGLKTMDVRRTESDRVSELTLSDNTFSGREIREKLELQSSDFTIKQNNNHLVFTTKGYGHGIGMSQYGANGMAKEGKDYQEIVKYYYQGIEVHTIDDIAPTLVAK